MPTQKNRLLAIETPLGPDVLLLNQLTGWERISGLFRFELGLLAEPSKAASIKAEALIGKNVTITTTLADGRKRYFNGIVTRFSQGSADERFAHFKAEVAPWLWLLTLTTDCQIFQDKSIPDIVQQVFKDLGFADFRSKLTRTYTKLDYCVQYRETHFNFISRLLEREGIFYFFEHDNGKHTLVLGDSNVAHEPCPNQSTAKFDPKGETGLREETVTSWHVEQELRAGKHTLRDYNFQLPRNSLEVSEPTTIEVANNNKLEVFDFPGEYAERFVEPDQRLGDVQPEGQALARLRMEEDEAAHKQVHGESYCRTFTSGFQFDLRNHPQSALNGSYTLTALAHSAIQTPDYYSDGQVEERPYQNTFTCIPHSVPFRPSRVTPRPVVQGPQSAIVVGKKGEEIWTDKYGRVKVQFHWDRKGKMDESSSCWIRVAHTTAGKRWGMFFLPRIGQEVLVAFLEGDPDHPVVVGGVYNAEQMPSYDLPAEQTKSLIKSNTSKGGQGFNEIRFEDKSGAQQIFLHAERNMDVRVKNDSMEHVVRDRHLIVGSASGSKGNQNELVYGNKHLNVKQDHVEKIEGNMMLTVKGDGGNQEIVIGANKKEMVGGDSHERVKGDRNEKIDGTLSRNVGMKVQEKVGMVHAVDAGQEIHLKGGMKVVIEAGLQLTIKGAGGFIDIGPAGVTIQGNMVMINSGGAAGSGSGCSPTAPQDAKDASPSEPTRADDSKTGFKSSSD